MTLNWTKDRTLKAIIFFTFVTLIFSCGRKRNKTYYSHHPSGYHWKLISFTQDSAVYFGGKTAHVSALFCTQNDSVFYDSKHDLRDRFFVQIDSLNKNNKLRQLISRCNEGDSICALLPNSDFFKEQFGREIPYFSKNDSVVKVYFKVKEILDDLAYDQLIHSIVSNEQNEIKSFFGSSEKMKEAKDSLGFYWVEKPTGTEGEIIQQGDIITLNYEGSFLDGRIVDISPKNFSLNYGTPDQLILGLNYVIRRLKIGQNSKIILPSQLAFGELGSSNGSIAPYTPMLYKISIITKK